MTAQRIVLIIQFLVVSPFVSLSISFAVWPPVVGSIIRLLPMQTIDILLCEWADKKQQLK